MRRGRHASMPLFWDDAEFQRLVKGRMHETKRKPIDVLKRAIGLSHTWLNYDRDRAIGDTMSVVQELEMDWLDTLRRCLREVSKEERERLLEEQRLRSLEQRQSGRKQGRQRLRSGRESPQ